MIGMGRTLCLCVPQLSPPYRRSAQFHAESPTPTPTTPTQTQVSFLQLIPLSHTQLASLLPLQLRRKGVWRPHSCHQLDKPPQPESHHAEVVAIHALDDRRTIALNAVRARLVHRLARRDVGVDLVVAQ